MTRDEFRVLELETNISIAEVNESHAAHWYMQEYKSDFLACAEYHRKRANWLRVLIMTEEEKNADASNISDSG